MTISLIPRSLPVLVASLLLSACTTVTVAPPPPVTVPEIVQMSRQKVPPQEIIQRINNSHTYYRLSASQLADLRKQGVSDPVLNYMQETHLQAVRNDQALRDRSEWVNHGGWWYGGVNLVWRDRWRGYDRPHRPRPHGTIRPRPEHPHHPNRPDRPDRPKPKVKPKPE